MKDFSKLFFIVAVATAVNVIAQIRENRNPVTPVIGSGIMLVMLGTIASLWRGDIAVIMATLFLVSTLVLRGGPAVQTLNELVQGARQND